MINAVEIFTKVNKYTQRDLFLFKGIDYNSFMFKKSSFCRSSFPDTKLIVRNLKRLFQNLVVHV